uniref:Potassium channel domain-containing protein n=1 Tax=Panagrolaimus superbus TaxID=310955 RepID=A0A914YDD9_9BILA
MVVLDEMPAWKKYARIILPHIGLIILSLLYIVGGAFVFYYLEHPNEVFVRGESLRLIEENRKVMLNHLWLLVSENSTTREEVENSVIEHVDNASKLLFDAFDTHFIFVAHLRNPSNQVDFSWTMTTSVFYTTTLLTTIGYGNLVPVTFKGRIFCIFYALFGVPLILITVADIGKFLSENIVWLYGLYVKKRTRQPRTSSTENLNEDEEEGHAPETKEFLATMDVGFGDIVPVKQQFFVFDLFYIIIGLAITTMCIDLVGIQYIRKIHYFGRAIKDARYALVNVGGRMVRVPDLIRLATVLQQKYGQRKRGSFDIWNGAYRPNDLQRIRYIDYSSGASIDSLSSFVSSIFSGNNKAKEPVRL